MIETNNYILYNDNMKINGSISHDRREETPEAKACWFQSLSMSDRREILCSFTDLALTVNPSLPEKKIAQPIPGRIQVIAKTGAKVCRDVDLEGVRLQEINESEVTEQPDGGNELSNA